MSFLGSLRYILAKITGTPYQSGLLQIRYLQPRISRVYDIIQEFLI